MPAVDQSHVTLSLDRSPELAMTALYRAAIGPINSDYYLPLFTRFEAAGGAGLSWNWAASVYTLNWMIFRRLWWAALIYVAALLTVLLVWLGLGPVFLNWSSASEALWRLACLIVVFVLPGLLGNALFHAKTHKDMSLAISATHTLQEACEQLSQQASSRQRFIRLLSVNSGLVAVATLTYLLWPSQKTIILIADKASAAVPKASFIIKPDVPDSPASTVTWPKPVPLTASALPASAASAPTLAPLQISAKVSEPVPVLAASEAIRPNSTTVKAPTSDIYINVGLFADANNARLAYAKLQSAGLPALTQEVTIQGKTMTRIRVGPYHSRAKAQTSMTKIRTLKLDAALAKP
jgi:hypothetical protein